MGLELRQSRRSLDKGIKSYLKPIDSFEVVLPASSGDEAADGADFEPLKRPLRRASMGVCEIDRSARLMPPRYKLICVMASRPAVSRSRRMSEWI